MESKHTINLKLVSDIRKLMNLYSKDRSDAENIIAMFLHTYRCIEKSIGRINLGVMINEKENTKINEIIQFAIDKRKKGFVFQLTPKIIETLTAELDKLQDYTESSEEKHE